MRIKKKSARINFLVFFFFYVRSAKLPVWQKTRSVTAPSCRAPHVVTNRRHSPLAVIAENPWPAVCVTSIHGRTDRCRRVQMSFHAVWRKRRTHDPCERPYRVRSRNSARRYGRRAEIGGLPATARKQYEFSLLFFSHGGRFLFHGSRDEPLVDWLRAIRVSYLHNIVLYVLHTQAAPVADFKGYFSVVKIERNSRVRVP